MRAKRPRTMATAKVKNKHTRLQFSDFAVELGFAVTYHKSQGKTLQRVVLVLDGRGTIKLGGLYVAISRVRSGAHLRMLQLSDKARKQLCKLKFDKKLVDWIKLTSTTSTSAATQSTTRVRALQLTTSGHNPDDMECSCIRCANTHPVAGSTSSSSTSNTLLDSPRAQPVANSVHYPDDVDCSCSQCLPPH